MDGIKLWKAKDGELEVLVMVRQSKRSKQETDRQTDRQKGIVPERCGVRSGPEDIRKTRE